jgi:chromosome segregation ATPase
MPHPNPTEDRSQLAEDRDYQQDRRDDRQNRRDDQHDAANEIARADERIKGLERWQVSQNGSLKRIEDKLDAHQGSTTGRFDSLQASSTKRFDDLQKWMMSGMVTALLALAGMVFSLLRK